jgi:hypothetical protein
MLHIFSGDNQSPAWLTEGVAVYCESPQRRFGRLILGGIEANPLVQNYLAAFRRGRHVPLEDLLRLKTFTDWTGTHDPKPQYEAAGALVCFCMEARGRQYRADFIDYLRDSYRGTTEGHELWEYLGWNQPTLAAHFEAWLSEVSRNSAEQTSGGN